MADYERLVVNLTPEEKHNYRLWCAKYMEGNLSAVIKTFVGAIADFQPGPDDVVAGIERMKWGARNE